MSGIRLPPFRLPMGAFRLAGPLVHKLPPERAHRLTIQVVASGLAPQDKTPSDPILACRLWDLDLPNPVGLAAGFDKDAEVPGPMLALGFGFVEIGSVTPQPQPGNPRPRLFRLPDDDAVINRMGFNSQGQDKVAARLGKRDPAAGIVGVNLGKNRNTEDAAADFAKGAARFAALADYLVVNVSSPNTPGLRALQGRKELADLLERVKGAMAGAPGPRTPPLLVKVAPDLTEEDRCDIALVARDLAIDGLIVCNTTIDRPDDLAGEHRGEFGWLSGRPLFGPSTALLAEFYRLTEGRIPLVGVGGIASGADAYAKIRAGASLVQLYTALVYQGPALVREIKTDLAARLRADGFDSVAAAVGANLL